MANIHVSEPQTQGLITFKTNFGDIDIELFTKQCPKVTKNFVQFCLDGYYDGASFTRVEKDFIAVGGDNEEDIEADIEHAPDEFHSRLRFTRRGLLATANTKKDENGQAFFFTLGPTPELQNKHTIFGRVAGNTVFSLVDLNECQVDDDLRPTTDKVIKEVMVKENPFPNLAPRSNIKSNRQDEISSPLLDDEYDPLAKPKIDPTKLKKLSFFPADEDDDDEEDEQHETKSGRLVATQPQTTIVFNNPSQEITPVIDHSKLEDTTNSDNPDGDNKLGAREKRLREIREQIRSIKEQIEKEPEIKTLSQRRQESIESRTSEQHSAVKNLEDSIDGIQLRIAGKKSRHREKETIEIVNNFKKKLRTVTRDEPALPKRSEVVNDEFDSDELAALDKVDGDDWLNHKFDANDGVRLARDANTKDDSWYSIDDPRRDMHRKEYHGSSHRHRHRDTDHRYSRRSPDRNSSSSRSRH